VESGKGKSTLQRLRPVTLAGVVCLGLATTGSALAANTPVVPCDEVARDLRSLTVARSDLSVSINDSGSIQDNTNTDSVDADAATEDPTAPMLYLTPRVATILETVFDNDAESHAGENSGDSADATDDGQRNESFESQQKSAPVTAIDKDAVVPQFQRHMFRKDI